MTPNQIQNIEKKLGRKLTVREVLNEEIDVQNRRDNRTFDERVNASAWQPVLEQSKVPTTKFDGAIAEYEREALAERRKNMSHAEWMVLQMKQARADELKAQESAAALAARMKSPEVSKPLAALRELRERMRWDAAYGMKELEAVDRALSQYETPGADLQVAKRLLDEALAAEKATESTQRDAVLAKKAIQAEESELSAALNRLSLGSEAAGAQVDREQHGGLYDAYIAASNASLEAASKWLKLQSGEHSVEERIAAKPAEFPSTEAVAAEGGRGR